jgi:tRNA U38,U39,U40 pseudouridine synthase TruA
MITQEKLNKLHELNKEEVKQILDECIEVLGVCDISESCEALNVQKSRIYQLMNDKNTLQIGKHKFLMINKL